MLASLIRTVVPFIVGVLLTLLAKIGLQDLVVLGDLTELVTIIVTAAYYAIVRWLEETVSPRFGWLLGYAAPPKYPTPTEAAAGLAPVPPSEVVARLDPGRAVIEALPGHPVPNLLPPVVAGPASHLTDGTLVEVNAA